MPRLTLHAAWKRLRKSCSPPTKSDFRVIELITLGDSRVYAAMVNNSGMPAVVFDVPRSDCPVDFADTRTTCIAWNSSQAGPQLDRVNLVLELRHPLLGDVFEALATYVVSFTEQEQLHFSAAVSARIAVERWHKLFDPASSGLPPGFPNVDRLFWKLLGTFPKSSSSGDEGQDIPF